MWPFLLGMSILLAAETPVAPPSPKTLLPPSTASGPADVRLVAESERTLSRVVLGLDPVEARYLFLPDTSAWGEGREGPRLAWLRRRLYWLDFELKHGQLFRYAPAQTRFFLAVPVAPAPARSLGAEENLFRQYLRERVGWPEEKIRERIRFFTVRRPIPFPQDMAEAIGYDARGRLVLALGLDCDDLYRDAVERLVQQYPQEFVLRRLPGLSTEGGDLALVRLPDSRLALLIGRNRVVRFLETRNGFAWDGRPLSPAQIEEARRVYREAFFGLDVVVIGEDGLRDPRLANPELFHLDMMAAVFRSPVGITAFVPTYASHPADALSHDPFAPDVIARLQSEYDRDARQLEALGYRVARLPFADHPVRSPVGAAKFFDPVANRSIVLLGRYPYHLELSDGRNPQRRLQHVFQELDAAVEAWRQAPTGSAWSGVETAIRNAWQEMDRAAASPNPIFDRQKAIYESNGIEVHPVPIFPTGEGGIHCIVLQ